MKKVKIIEKIPVKTIHKSKITRRTILHEAMRVFAEKGYAAAGVVDIVERLDTSHGTYYYHFRDKKEALFALLDEFFRKIKAVAAGWAATTDTTPETAETFVRNLAWLLYDNSELAIIALREDYRAEPDIQSLIGETTAYLYDQTEKALNVGIVLGTVRPMDTKIAAAATIGMIKEVVFDIIDRDARFDAGYVAGEVARLHNYGIRPRAKDEKKARRR